MKELKYLNAIRYNKYPRNAELWSHCLKQYPRPETKPYVKLPSRSLDPSVWIATYLAMMKLATKGRALVRLFGLAYMKSDDILMRHIENLPTPDPVRRIHYDELFEKTQQNIIAVWTQLAAALDAGDLALFKLPNASLDDGIATETERSVYWA